MALQGDHTVVDHCVAMAITTTKACLLGHIKRLLETVHFGCVKQCHKLCINICIKFLSRHSNYDADLKPVSSGIPYKVITLLVPVTMNSLRILYHHSQVPFYNFYAYGSVQIFDSVTSGW